jgi:hypothetical protein
MNYQAIFAARTAVSFARWKFGARDGHHTQELSK